MNLLYCIGFCNNGKGGPQCARFYLHHIAGDCNHSFPSFDFEGIGNRIKGGMKEVGNVCSLPRGPYGKTRTPPTTM